LNALGLGRSWSSRETLGVQRDVSTLAAFLERIQRRDALLEERAP
jgi:hypothetical protein